MATLKKKYVLAYLYDGLLDYSVFNILKEMFVYKEAIKATCTILFWAGYTEHRNNTFTFELRGMFPAYDIAFYLILDDII